MFIPFLLAHSTAFMAVTWTLTAETTGFTTYNQSVGTITGPTTLYGDDTEGRTCILGFGVDQEKGQPGWDTPWSPDLASVYFYFMEEPIHWGDLDEEPIHIPSGLSKNYYVTIRTDRHTQQWHGSDFLAGFSGTAIRNGAWDSQIGWGATSI